MFVCYGRYSVVKDITFVVKGTETFFSDFECVNLLLQRPNSAEVAIVDSVPVNVQR